MTPTSSIPHGARALLGKEKAVSRNNSIISATSPNTIRFGALSNDLKKLEEYRKAQAAIDLSNAAMEKERQDMPKRIELLEKTFSTPDGKNQTMNGFEVLDLVDEITRKTRYGLSRNLKRVTMVLGIVTLIPAYCFCLAMTGGGDNPFANTFTNGPSRVELSRLLNVADADLTSKLAEFESLDLLRRHYSSQADADCWQLTAKGKKLLALWKQNNRLRPAMSIPKPEEQQALLPPMVLLSSSPINENHRLKVIQALTTEPSSSITGWQLLKQLGKSQGSLLTRLFSGKSVKEHTLFLQSEGNPNRQAFHQRMISLEKLGLVENTGTVATPDKSQWQLTRFAQTLLKEPDAIKALGVTDKDVQKLVEQQIKELETEKETKFQELEQLKQKHQNALGSLPPIQAELEAADAKALETDEQRRQATSEEAKASYSIPLQEQLFKARLLNEKVQFHQAEATLLGQQVQATTTYLSQWSHRMNTSILKLHQSLFKLKQLQGEQAIHEVMKELQKVHEQVDEQQRTQERQIQDLIAEVSPSVPGSSEESALTKGAIAHGNALEELSIEEQLRSARERHESAKAASN